MSTGVVNNSSPYGMSRPLFQGRGGVGMSQTQEFERSLEEKNSVREAVTEMRHEEEIQIRTQVAGRKENWSYNSRCKEQILP